MESFAQSSSSSDEKATSQKWKDLEGKNWDEEVGACDENIQRMDKVLDQIVKMKVRATFSFKLI